MLLLGVGAARVIPTAIFGQPLGHPLQPGTQVWGPLGPPSSYATEEKSWSSTPLVLNMPKPQDVGLPACLFPPMICKVQKMLLSCVCSVMPLKASCVSRIWGKPLAQSSW